MRLRTFGLDTLAALLGPSYIAHRHWIPNSFLSEARIVFGRADLLGIFICVVIVGSLLNLTRRELLVGLLKIWVPLLAASVVAIILGAGVGLAAGLPINVVLLKTVVPALVGGLTGGALPLAAAYAHAFGTAAGSELAQLLPAVVTANLLAVFAAGTISALGWRKGLDAAAISAQAAPLEVESKEATPRSAGGILAAMALLAGIYILGGLVRTWWGIPAPLVFLVCAAVLQLLSLPPQWLTAAVLELYRACIRFLTYPLLLSVGLLLMPWQDFLDGLHIANIAVLAVIVAALALMGAWAARWVGLPAKDGAIIAVTRAAMGGSGDVAILNAAHRLDLMAFAQIATRLGGAATLALTLLALVIG